MSHSCLERNFHNNYLYINKLWGGVISNCQYGNQIVQLTICKFLCVKFNLNTCLYQR